MKKHFMILIFLFAGFSIFAANENNIINASPKYFGQYVSYKNPQGILQMTPYSIFPISLNLHHAQLSGRSNGISSVMSAVLPSMVS